VGSDLLVMGDPFRPPRRADSLHAADPNAAAEDPQCDAEGGDA